MVASPHLRDLERDLEMSRDGTVSSLKSVLEIGLATRRRDEGLHAAILLKEFGAFSAATRVFARMTALHGNDPSIAYERSLCLRAFLAPEAANRVIARALESGVVSRAIALDLLLAAELDETAAHVAREASALFLRARAAIDDPVCEALRAYVLRRGPALRRAARLEPARQATPVAALRLVLGAIRAARPFCFLRLGDGEGAFLDREAEAVEQPIFTEIRAFWAHRWCGVDGEHAGLQAAAEALKAGMQEVDLLGVPPASWIRNELVRRQLRGLVGCLNATSFGMETGARLASTTLPLDWQARRMIASVLRHAGTIDLVTCRPNLAPLLEEKLGIRVARIIAIAPPHKERVALSPLLDDIARVRAEVQASASGRVVVIGAGFLGKILALDAKRAGAIGLDFGAILDLLAGQHTRREFFSLGAGL
jgi:hypothetical protein